MSRGCEACNYTGYNTREAIAEILVMNQDLEDFIFKKIEKTQMLSRLEQANPNFTLIKKAFNKAECGITDLKEVYRVVK